MRRAFTLAEVIIVVGIIALLALLLLPVLIKAKASSKGVVCISNLRQIGAAWNLYSSSNNEQAAPTLTALMQESTIKDLLKCPADRVAIGSNPAESSLADRPISYFYLPNNQSFRRDLEAVDGNHGIAYCVQHGNWLAAQVNDARVDTEGLVHRLRRDSSVQKAQVHFVCEEDSGGSLRGRPDWILLTDIWPCPAEWCGTKPVKCR